MSALLRARIALPPPFPARRRPPAETAPMEISAPGVASKRGRRAKISARFFPPLSLFSAIPFGRSLSPSATCLPCPVPANRGKCRKMSQIMPGIILIVTAFFFEFQHVTCTIYGTHAGANGTPPPPFRPAAGSQRRRLQPNRRSQTCPARPLPGTLLPGRFQSIRTEKRG
jgi:hypothetical protein